MGFLTLGRGGRVTILCIEEGLSGYRPVRFLFNSERKAQWQAAFSADDQAQKAARNAKGFGKIRLLDAVLFEIGCEI